MYKVKSTYNAFPRNLDVGSHVTRVLRDKIIITQYIPYVFTTQIMSRAVPPSPEESEYKIAKNVFGNCTLQTRMHLSILVFWSTTDERPNRELLVC
jgi:hypothetical protein